MRLVRILVLMLILALLDPNQYLAKKTYALLGYNWTMDKEITATVIRRTGNKDEVLVYSNSGAHRFLVKAGSFPKVFRAVQLLTPDNKIKFCFQDQPTRCLN